MTLDLSDGSRTRTEMPILTRSSKHEMAGEIGQKGASLTRPESAHAWMERRGIEGFVLLDRFRIRTHLSCVFESKLGAFSSGILQDNLRVSVSILDTVTG